MDKNKRKDRWQFGSGKNERQEEQKKKNLAILTDWKPLDVSPEVGILVFIVQYPPMVSGHSESV